ncbi:hypothetical protein [Novosphingobium lindaniclasticum]|uniref:Uncharacterized protein n=1 Tax=Novosphingobium lindaniclasticum LE124 TaxID=1096930 RepID=T0HLF9_9SPHN|nr:hypothetical protein [Novosphingobium lindaniclasticum]EQB13013.1 hypothetical protein L284_14765 [Novosphingobium lindaniclasticum LE124]
MKFTLAAIGLVFAALAASPSGAQTSTCYRLGNIASCSLQPNGDENPAQRRYSGFQEAERLRKDNADREEAQKQQGLLEEVGALVADGRCSDARKTALRAGDFALADRAGGMCKPAGKR